MNKDHKKLFEDLRDWHRMGGASDNMATTLALFAVNYLNLKKGKCSKECAFFRVDLKQLIQKYQDEGTSQEELLLGLFCEAESIIVSDYLEHKNDVSVHLKAILQNGEVVYRLMPD